VNPWLVLVFVILAIAYVIVAWVGLFYLITRTKVQARVKHKIGHEDFHSLNWEYDTVRKILVFECEDGTDRDYDVPDSVWDFSKEGDDGVLEYQGELFVDFHARRPRDMDREFRRLTRM